MSEDHVLVVGCGSVGKRHARNLKALGCRISCVDPRKDRQEELKEDTIVEGAYESLEEALKGAKNLTGVVIASPPVYHVDQTCQALELGLPVLLEKPVSPDLNNALRLKEKIIKTGVPLLLGYTWRWWKPLIEVKRLLDEHVIGDLRNVRFVMSANLADWHPWEPYQTFFVASRELGGGAILDESHWIDLMVWFFGMPKAVFSRIDKISDLDIETDDNVDMLCEYPGSLCISMHLDLFGRPHEKHIAFVGEKGTIRWSAEPNQIALGHDMTQTWDIRDFTCERNDMFMDVGREFIEVMKCKPVQTCSIEDGVKVLQVIESARISHVQRRMVSLLGD